MEQLQMLRHLVDVMKTLEVRYFVTGSLASITYGEPRFTNDIDIVVELRPEHIDPLCAAFPDPRYYCSRQAAVDAVRKRFQFNIIEVDTGMKADVIVPPDTEFGRARFDRILFKTVAGGVDAWLASPEDIILNKLLFYREGRSDKHIRDIAGVLKVQAERIDRVYILGWVEHFGLHAEWQLALDRSTIPFP
jgi:hypothetical protein